MAVALCTSATLAAPRATRRASRIALHVRATVETKEAPAAKEGAAPAAAPTVVRPHPTPAPSSFPDALELMGFNGAAPELVNGRLAMVGFLAALGAELFTGATVGQQFWAAPKPVLITIGLFIAASLVPIVRGVRNDEAFGPLTPEAELFNGRAAMIGFFSLIIIETFRGTALF